MMLWFMIILLSLVCLLPCMMVLYHHSPSILQGDESALYIYKSQLSELEKEFNSQLIMKEAYDQAKLEIHRRILALDQQSISPVHPPSKNGRAFIAAGLFCIPLSAVGLYLVDGTPSLPPQPLRQRQQEQQAANQQLRPYIQELMARLALLSPTDPKYIQGYLLLGKIQADQGDLDSAIHSWKTALTQRFNPDIAVTIAEADIQLKGYMTPESLNLLEKALKTAPTNAPWREMVEQRLAEYRKDHH